MSPKKQSNIDFFFEKKTKISEIYWSDFKLNKEYALLLIDFTNPMKPSEATGWYFKFNAICLCDYPELKLVKNQKCFVDIGIRSFRRGWNNSHIEPLNPEKKYDMCIKFLRREKSLFILEYDIQEQSEDKYPEFDYGLQ